MKPRKGPLAPLPPLVVDTDKGSGTKTAWGDAPDPPTPIKSPLSKVAAFLHSSSFDKSNSPSIKDQEKHEKIDRSRDRKISPEPREGKARPPRRESIKDHLLKFKLKAGKVFEEVHDRLVEDHSMPVAPSPLKLETSDIAESEDSSAQNLDSPSSLASKRTSTSADIKASLRSKIRKQAEKAVERTRGNVQLTKRLQRRMTTHIEEGPTELDLRDVDEQIENSLKLGERFLDSLPPSSFPPAELQFLFVSQEIPKEKTDEETKEMVVYRPAGPAPEEQPTLFATISTKRPPDATKNIHSRIFKYPLMEAEDYQYRKAEPWSEDAMSKFSHLNVKIGSLYLFNHKLATNEELAVCSLHFWNAKQMECIELLSQSISDQSEIDFHSNSVALRLRECAEAVLRQFQAVQASRDAQGFSLTSVSVREMNFGENTEILLAIVGEENPITPIKDLPQQIVNQLKNRSKNAVWLELYYNEVFVGTTMSRLIDDLKIDFEMEFPLEVKSPPQSLKAFLCERISGKRRYVTQIEIPPASSSHTLELPFQETTETIDLIDRQRGIIQIDIRWEKENNFDIQSPTKEKTKSEKIDGFYLIPPALRLVSDEEFESDIRWDLLERRFKQRIAADVRRVPMFSSEIDPSAVFPESRFALETTYRTEVDAHRALGTTNALMLRRKILERSDDGDLVSYEELVREEPLPQGFGAFSGLFGATDTSRKLKPMRRDTRRQLTVAPTECRILLNIQAASDLAVRKDGTLQPVVMASFQGNSAVSRPASGKHPNWQQSLSIPIDIIRSTDLKSIIDYIHIEIYDQIVSPLAKDDREINTIHEQLRRRIIGSVAIPFSTLLCKGKIEGTLRLKLPLFITGYNLSDRPSYIKMLIALDPPLVAPKLLRRPAADSHEPDKIFRLCQNWQKSCEQEFEHRRFVALVTNSGGRSVVACRYLRPLRPPSSIENLGVGRKAVEMAAQAVSFIPFLADPLLFPGTLDLWTTVDQFLSFGCGDEEEHAVLLCCWLMGMRIQSWLVLGTALPEGEKAAYVMIDLPDSLILVNPTDGNIYKLDDGMCPLSAIGTIVTSENIYANIQPLAHPSQMHFDFSKSSDWRPVFGKSYDKLSSVQPSHISYQQVSEDSLIELRSSLEREIKLQIDTTRRAAVPQWNVMASRLLREILQDQNWNTVGERLSRLRDAYAAYATAIRIPYRSLGNCVSEVLRLQLHIDAYPEAQFALGVYVQPLFNNVISCSIAVAVLSSQR